MGPRARFSRQSDERLHNVVEGKAYHQSKTCCELRLELCGRMEITKVDVASVESKK